MRPFILPLVLCTALAICLQTVAAAARKGMPHSIFTMIHFEAGGDAGFPLFQNIVKAELKKDSSAINNRDLVYQQALWPTAVKLVKSADRYDFKLTLALNPQWAKYILQDMKRVKTVGLWLENGHEIAFHHHGVNHIDWNGYSNRLGRNSTIGGGEYHRYRNKLNNGDYLGTVDEGFQWVKTLVALAGSSQKVISGCITDTRIDLPDEVTILTEGGKRLEKDLISPPLAQHVGNRSGRSKKITWMRHAFLGAHYDAMSTSTASYSKQSINKKVKKELKRITARYPQAGEQDVVGVVFHVFDYYYSPTYYDQWFTFVHEKKKKIKTIQSVVNSYSGRHRIEQKMHPGAYMSNDQDRKKSLFDMDQRRKNVIKNRQ